ncbi:hypothetical protein KV112_12295 [Mycolicibacter sp. MYC123]|uniref:Uncharacterized protein n=1 Tax=[Mycobacterium] zoologicum TaxID=2872311 RepID=A0ABU5YKF3_9MYCO|nr:MULTISPECIES: hypothetical protein [unclassified Mycolicibacter]MEB3050509.1 hypothetical protein [Mycolicibacter sp. MYC123]MEB3063015.1 hypothetical protein [Mycolicibacter sp. MYC101]
MGRFEDELHLVEPSAYVPSTVPALLRQAGLTDATRDAQAALIREWLKTHQPIPLMEYSIRDMGFGKLLDERMAI